MPVKCPKCGEEVEFLYRKKGHLYCPKCGKKVLRRELPPDAVVDVRPYPEPEEPPAVAEDEDEEEVEEERAERAWEKRRSAKPTPLFEEPREPVEIIAEILLDWGCDEDFVRKITEYINAKGVVDLGWLMTVLTSARTGRRFTPQEAFMVVDMIASALEKERRKAEEFGRSFPLGVIPLNRPGSTPTPIYGGAYYSQPTSYAAGYTSAPSAPGYSATPPSHQPATATAGGAALTPQAVEEIVKRAIAEQRKADVIDELKKMIYELEKRRVEDRAEMEKKIVESAKAVEDRISQRLESTLKEIKDAISSLQVQQSPPSIGIDKKDLELMRAELEKAYLSRISELEKKLLEAKSEAEKREILSQLQEVRSRLESVEKERAKPVSPEGWQSDEARLVAELGTRFLDIIRERKPMEYLVRIVPKPEERHEKTEKSLADLIREAGGEVEE